MLSFNVEEEVVVIRNGRTPMKNNNNSNINGNSNKGKIIVIITAQRSITTGHGVCWKDDSMIAIL